LRTVVIFTEGRNSEPDYLNGLRRLPHIAGDVALDIESRPEHSVPLARHFRTTTPPPGCMR
jgi:hypothetical protein